MAWQAKTTGGYTTGSAESIANAVAIYQELTALGFGYNAICAILGNIGYESGYNPWRWQMVGGSDYVVSTWETYYINNQTGHAYGLLQFDPAGRYINNATAQGYPQYGPNFADQPGLATDGSAQLKWMDAVDCQPYPGNGAYIPTSSYPLSYSAFKTSTSGVSYLTAAWEYNYERGTWNNLRDTYAQYWFNNLINYIGNTIPVWMYFKFKGRG